MFFYGFSIVFFNIYMSFLLIFLFLPKNFVSLGILNKMTSEPFFFKFISSPSGINILVELESYSYIIVSFPNFKISTLFFFFLIFLGFSPDMKIPKFSSAIFTLINSSLKSNFPNIFIYNKFSNIL